MSDEYLDSMKEDFAKVVQSFKRELSVIRTGRASPQLLDNVQVEVSSYGATMPLKQLATVSAPDPRLLVVNPWDKGTINDIEKAIRAADLGLNPSNDGQVVRVPIPPLTGERREQLVRSVRKMTEEHRVAARRVRREYNDVFKDLEAEGEITQDDLLRYLDRVQKATDACIEELEELAKAKEKEVREL